MSVRIPEGYAFVPRGEGVAAKLLAAADEVGADQATAVRSITGGYHVLEEVAEAYAAAAPEAVEYVADDPNGEPAELVGEEVDAATIPDGVEVPVLGEADEAPAEKPAARRGAKTTK